MLALAQDLHAAKALLEELVQAAAERDPIGALFRRRAQRRP
jgi:hypothetical protein